MTPSIRPGLTPSSHITGFKRAVFALCLLPLARALWLAASGDAINPIEFLTRSTGTWTLSWLLLTLAITPLRTLTGLSILIRLRRMLGLFAFFYGVLHLTLYLWLDKFFDWPAIGHDIVKRPFITMGMAAWLLMLPLAVTSTQGWIKRLKRRWGLLHRLIYPLTVMAVVHYFWLVKKDLTQPLIYGTVLAVLLLWRVARRVATRARPAPLTASDGGRGTR
ncbi:sulfite oxidase heme-binding subunit YedZ [Paludibacterium yongneupense]|uniref:sulfite oxidase heme-binding subunit YedZ n=1 Tax=Paludibacterium yongneupense TaxID=400061 RepID=UPI00041B5B31|nr:protein-methionine-sulfoxide reductase heme-binding subunit MsrQ [Paludibacterium yongneupense]